MISWREEQGESEKVIVRLNLGGRGWVWFGFFLPLHSWLSVVHFFSTKLHTWIYVTTFSMYYSMFLGFQVNDDIGRKCFSSDSLSFYFLFFLLTRGLLSFRVLARWLVPMCRDAVRWELVIFLLRSVNSCLSWKYLTARIIFSNFHSSWEAVVKWPSYLETKCGPFIERKREIAAGQVEWLGVYFPSNLPRTPYQTCLCFRLFVFSPSNTTVWCSFSSVVFSRPSPSLASPYCFELFSLFFLQFPLVTPDRSPWAFSSKPKHGSNQCILPSLSPLSCSWIVTVGLQLRDSRPPLSLLLTTSFEQFTAEQRSPACICRESAFLHGSIVLALNFFSPRCLMALWRNKGWWGLLFVSVYEWFSGTLNKWRLPLRRRLTPAPPALPSALASSAFVPLSSREDVDVWASRIKRMFGWRIQRTLALWLRLC